MTQAHAVVGVGFLDTSYCVVACVCCYTSCQSVGSYTFVSSVCLINGELAVDQHANQLVEPTYRIFGQSGTLEKPRLFTLRMLSVSAINSFKP
jgi:hypothetical protein